MPKKKLFIVTFLLGTHEHFVFVKASSKEDAERRFALMWPKAFFGKAVELPNE